MKNLKGEDFLTYGIIALVVSMLYRVLAPLINWIVYLIPTLALTAILYGLYLIYIKKEN